MLLSLSVAYADVRLPKIFGDGMVLQRHVPIAVWGWADPGETVTVRLNLQTKQVITGNDGVWRLKLDAEQAGGPFQLIVKGHKNECLVDDVLIGEVWICSGQSNMEWTVQRSANAEQEIAAADYPQIRHIKLGRAVAGIPLDDISNNPRWRKVSPETVGTFTAVGYYYARELHRELGVPIGIINSSWGGTMVETWTSREALEAEPVFRDVMTKMTDVPIDTLNNAKPNHYPSLLFNAMINPLIPYTIRGAIWYQGEANVTRAYQYRTAFPTMINDWRNRWEQGDFPFYFVQLSSFKGRRGTSKKGSTWAELREAQHATLSLPHTGQAITTDIGESDDIHPKNKQDVGKRLAVIALQNTYGRKEIICNGPVYKQLKIERQRAIVSFDHVYGGLCIKQGAQELEGFEIAGSDQRFYPAVAQIKDNKVIVSSNKVQQPAAVRYNWADDAIKGNLFNKEGFPAAPFRTDNWPEITRDKVFSLELR